MPYQPPILPAAPLAARLEKAAAAVGGIRPLLGVGPDRNYYRGLQSGHFTVAWIDEICILVLGCHPSEVYGNQWWIDE